VSCGHAQHADRSSHPTPDRGLARSTQRRLGQPGPAFSCRPRDIPHGTSEPDEGPACDGWSEIVSF
jgi:hypothetical protein